MLSLLLQVLKISNAQVMFIRAEEHRAQARPKHRQTRVRSTSYTIE